MMDTTFREVSSDPRTTQLPLSHLSLELGHLYMDDFAAGPGRLREQFARVKPWADAARAAATRTGGRRPRISTCFLIDDYFTRFSSPAEVLPQVLAEAAECGLVIDYLARESACAEVGAVRPARLAEARLVQSPPLGSNGSRPPATEVGWLSNGERSPSDQPGEAMQAAAGWQPPREIEARRHSVFLDVELWDEHEGRRTWSCPFLAAVWQLLRLGLLRDQGQEVLAPVPREETFPASWDSLPPLVRLNPAADPFAAYRTCSVLASRFLPIEHAVRVILAQWSPEESVLRQIAERAEREGLAMPDDVTDRINYVFHAPS
ncbi:MULTISPECIES: SCO2522 family protein [unclassified Kitasatospora]|uniref:SCO2522 family protein n=1 Tax=unclassified Kitasatospora TaxID=2633591 RepID=UPI002474AF24|nr:SCO2522 family protein [Kitasatospora sp. GAS204B]